MSWNDRYFMSRGYRVRHKYKHNHGGTRTCELCGTKRRWRPSGYEYRKDHPKWSATNPPCIRK